MFKSLINKKRKGFALTIEVIFTLMMVFMIINSTISIMAVMNSERYMNTILTSTTIQMAKLGGTDTLAYELNGLNESAIETAQKRLNDLAPILKPSGIAGAQGPVIKGSPRCISKNNKNVKVEITWRYPSIMFMNFTSNSKRTMEMESIMKPGQLIRGGNC